MVAVLLAREFAEKIRGRRMEEREFVNRDGIAVGLRSWPVQGLVRSAVVIAHGASEHSGRYDRFARALAAAGHAPYALDHQGHGRTAAATGVGRLGPRGMDGVLDDVGQLIALARAELPGRPVVLFGHSMGSLIAQGFVERSGHDLAGYVLSGCPGVPEFAPEMIGGIEDALAGGLGDAAADLFAPFNEPFEPARTPFDWLSRDAAEVDRYIEDPWCGDDMPLSYRYVASMLELATGAMLPDGLDRTPKNLPVLLVTGEQDPASQMAERVRVLERALHDAGLDVVARYYAGARHELLNETNRDEVHDHILAWLDDVVGRAAR
jgi:alpha-beta hydrolase superfamily lysophospholipase